MSRFLWSFMNKGVSVWRLKQNALKVESSYLNVQHLANADQ